MSMQLEDSLLDFNIDFFHQTPTVKVPEKKDKYRKAVSLVKKKVVATDSLIKRYYEKKGQVNELEQALYTSKEECKKVCIDLQNIKDKCDKLDSEAQFLRNDHQQLQVKCVGAENVVNAMQSHAHQLQSLIKQNETTIEALKIENQLEKSRAKDNEKKVSALQREKDALLKDIHLMKDIILGKKKLNKCYKALLQKYNKKYESDDSDLMLGDGDSEAETEIYCDLESPIPKFDTLIKPMKTFALKFESATPKHDYDLDSDFSIAPASADTGRGSSLAFSDSDKFFHSPDYIMEHSPINTDVIKSKVVHVGTSPIPFLKFAHTATSPITVEQPAETKIISIFDSREDKLEVPTSSNLKFVHTATSPITVEEPAGTNAISIFDSREDPPGVPTSSILKFVHTATSPITVEKHIETNVISIFDVRQDTPEVPTSSSFKFVHTATSPITVETPTETNLISITDLRGNTPEFAEKDVDENISGCTNNQSNQSAITNVTNETIPRLALDKLNEKACLELNNSNNLNKNGSRDGEIEMILSKMRLPHKLITPIPTTPSKSNHSSTSSDFVAKEPNHCVHKKNIVCKDFLAIKNENTVIRNDIVKLSREIRTIKNMLNSNHISIHQKPKICSTNDEKESDFSDDDIIVIPSEADHSNVSELVSSQSLSMGHKINKEPVVENQSIDECDIRKTTKRLQFEESILPIQNDLTQSIETIEETDCQEKSMCEMDSTNNFGKQTYKQRKLSKLDRLRQTLLPKNKIKGNKIEKIRKNKPKNIHEVTGRADEALKNKIAYEKAVKIMSDLKSQEKDRNITNTKSNGNGTLSNKEKDSRILLKIPKLKTRSENLFTTPNKVKLGYENTENIVNDEHINNQNTKRIIILEDVLLRGSQNYSNTVQAQQKPLESSLVSPLNVRKIKLTMPQNEESLNEVEHSLVNTSQLQVIEPEGNILITPQDLGFKSTEETKHTVNEVELCTFMNRNEPSNEMKSTDICLVNDSSIDNRKKTIESNHNYSEDLIKPHNSIVEQTEAECPKITSPTQQPTPQVLSTCGKMKVGDNSTLRCIIERNVVVENLISASLNHDSTANEDIKREAQRGNRKRQKRMSSENSDIECKRMLRSSTLRLSTSEGNAKVPNMTVDATLSTSSKTKPQIQENAMSYEDLELFNDDIVPNKCTDNIEETKQGIHPKDSILCVMIEKYVKQTVKNVSKKIPDSVSNTISSTLENEIKEIINSNENSKAAMDRLVETIRKWDCKPFMAGLMQYLKDPQRKIELFNKVYTPPAPPMTKSEQILLYVIIQLRRIWPSINIVDCLLCSIEYVLFKLNRTPDFDAIESMSHFYAITCRYFKMKGRLRIFMLDAMYCIQFKSVPLIKQCMEVWMHVLPLAHMGIAKSTLVTCMVYLLHFYKCEDKFNRVQDIRFLLARKYFYEITDWNEPKIIEMFKSAITNVRAIPLETKLLRISLIVIAKRHGPKWCQKNIVKNMLLPIIDSDSHTERVKIFCVSVLGPLIKPYPADMRVHIEIVMNKLIDMLNQNPSPGMEEAIFSALIYMSRHNYNRVVQTLLTWKPQRISADFEQVMQDFVCEKSRKMWKTILSKISLT